MIQSFLMREFGEWTADAHWCPSPWQGAEAAEGENTFFVVIHRTSRSGAMKKLHVKLTRRNRSHEMMKMMMATSMMMMMVTMMMMVMILIL